MSARRAGQTALVRPSTVVLPAVSLLLAAVLAGCGGSDPEPGPTKPPASVKPTGATRDVDVCGLVPAALRKQAFPRGGQTTELAYGSENIVVCGASVGTSFEFGYTIAEGASMPKAGAENTRALAGIGDRAVLHKDVGPPGKIVEATLWAQAHGITFYVRDSAIFNTGGTAVSLATARAVLRSLTDHVVPADVEQTPLIALGPRCPAADSAAVTAVVGPVVTARGGAQDVDDPVCQYLGRGGTRVHLDVLVQAGVEKDFFDASYQKKISMAGTRSAWTDKDPVQKGQVGLSWTTAADVLWMLDASPLAFGSDDRDGSGRATLANTESLGRAFIKANPDVGR